MFLGNISPPTGITLIKWLLGGKVFVYVFVFKYMCVYVHMYIFTETHTHIHAHFTVEERM